LIQVIIARTGHCGQCGAATVECLGNGMIASSWRGIWGLVVTRSVSEGRKPEAVPSLTLRVTIG